MRKVSLILSLLIAIIISSCKNNSKDDTNNTIEYSGPNVINIVLKESLALNATSQEQLQYHSDNERNVTISNDGVIFGKNVGEANITVSNTENKLTIPVIVNLFEEPTLNFGASTKEIRAIYGEPKRNFGDSVYVYGQEQGWYSYAVWEMNFFFNKDKYYESHLYIRNDLDYLVSKFLDENYFYYNELTDTLNNEVKTLHVYFDNKDPRFADIVVGKQYNVGTKKDILLVYASAESIVNSRCTNFVTE